MAPGQLTSRQKEVIADLCKHEPATVGALASGKSHWNGTWGVVKRLRDAGLVTLGTASGNLVADDYSGVPVSLTGKGKQRC